MRITLLSIVFILFSFINFISSCKPNKQQEEDTQKGKPTTQNNDVVIDQADKSEAKPTTVLPALGVSYGFLWVPLLEIIDTFGDDFDHYKITMTGSSIQNHVDRDFLMSTLDNEVKSKDLVDTITGDIPTLEDLEIEGKDKTQTVEYWENVLSMTNPLEYHHAYKETRRKDLSFFCIEDDKLTFTFEFSNSQETLSQKIDVTCYPATSIRKGQTRKVRFFRYHLTNENFDVELIDYSQAS